MKWRLPHIVSVFHALQFYEEDVPGIAEILQVMSQIATATIGRREEIVTARQLTMICSGLQHKRCEVGGSRSFLALTSTLMKACKENLTPTDLCDILNTMHKVSSGSPIALEILSALRAKMSRSSGYFTVTDIGRAMYGMQGMSSDCAEVRKMLSTIRQKILLVKEPYTSGIICNLMLGMQKMSSEEEVVREMISTISQVLNTFVKSNMHSKLFGKHVNRIVFGMQSMSSDVDEVRELLRILNPLILNCKDTLSAQEVGNIMFGMQRE
jgi:hypothetical protein